MQWDIRAKTTPVQKSTLAEHGHKTPVFGLGIVGQKAANKIVSISQDSRICQWHVGELSNPKDSFNLFTEGYDRTNFTLVKSLYKTKNQLNIGYGLDDNRLDAGDMPFIRVNTMEFPEDENDRFYIGAEDYNVYQANLHA